MKLDPRIISTPPLPTGDALPSDDAVDLESEGVLGSGSEIRPLHIGPAFHGQRLDRVLAALVPEFSRSYLQGCIAQRLVVLDGRVAVRASTAVKAGQSGQIELRPTPQSVAFQPQAMALDVVYEDEHLRVFNKPAGLVVHPAPGHWTGTLLNGLLAAYNEAAVLPRAGIVHRLDKDTSGLMVVARTRGAMDALVRMIAAREVRRQYLAIAHRPWQGIAHRTVNAPVGRDPRNRLRMAVVDLNRHPGKDAQTTLDLLDSGETGCLVRCTLHTGRTHQIRVHMASIGHPLLADALYGGHPDAGMVRQGLHAFHLALVHPVTAQPLQWYAPMPQDMTLAVAQWALRYNASPLEAVETAR